MAGETDQRRQAETSLEGGTKASRHSHFEYGSTYGKWDRDVGSDFVATSVNVPDRLDTQEVRARVDAESMRPEVSRFHREDILRAVRWFMGLMVLIGAGWWAASVLVPLRAAISTAGVERAVGKALGVPVSVAKTEVRFSPVPQLVISGLVTQSGIRLPEVALHFNWQDVLQAMRTSSWALGEARVAPLEMSSQEALALLQSIRAASGLPGALTTIRFEAVSFPDLALLPGRYGAAIRRGVGQRQFASIALTSLDGGGQAEIEIVAPAESGGSATFSLLAADWPASVGPAVVWSEATARGEFRPDFLKVDEFAARARFGTVSGAATLARESRGWRLAGSLRGPGLNIEELIRYAAGLSEATPPAAEIPLRGVAKFDLKLAGSGVTVEETVRHATASGLVSISGASIVGVNLGLAAAQGDAGGAGGSTRLTDLDLEIVASRDGVSVGSFVGRAGNLRVSGGFGVDRKLALNGSLRSEVRSPRGVVETHIRLGGRLAAPTFQ